MFILLLPAVWGAIFINLWGFNKKKQGGWNSGELVLITAAIFTLTLVFLTELLSLFQQLNRFWITLSWFLILVFLTAVFLLKYKKSVKLNSIGFGWPADLSLFYRLSLILLLIISTATFILGIIFPPNNVDASAYHLGRVVHWLQNRSVAFYPTHILTQVVNQPGAEYIAAHVLVLSDSDLFINLIQWFSMAGSLLAVYLMTGLLGGGKTARILAVTFAATLPMGVLQSNSAQNDYVGTLWFVGFIYFFLKGILEDKDKQLYIGLVFLGLAILTKVVNYFYGLSFLAIFLLPLWRKNGKKAVTVVLLFAAIVFAINSGFIIRTFILYRSPIPDVSSLNNTAKYFSPLMTAANMLTELFHQLTTPINGINLALKYLYGFCLYFLNSIDRGVTIEKVGHLLNSGLVLDEDLAVNTAHLIFILLAVIVGARLIKRKPIVNKYLWAVFLSVVILNTFLLWTVYNTRYYLNLFVAIAPVAGIISQSAFNQKTLKIFYLVFWLTAFIYLIFNFYKPWTDISKQRIDLYVNRIHRDYQTAYRKFSEIIVKNRYRRIGLNLELLYLEYPLWVYLKDKDYQDFRIEHVDVRNQTGKIKLRGFAPDAIIACDDCFLEAPKMHAVYSKWAKVRYRLHHFTLYGQ